MAGAGWRDFIAGEVLTAANVQDYLQDQAVMTFASSAARGSAIASPTEGMVSFLKDSNLIEAHDGSAWKQIGKTTGGILQVVSTSKLDTFTTTSSTYTAITGLSVAITPISTSSKIVIIAQLTAGSNSGGPAGHYRLYGGNSGTYIGAAAGNRVQAVFGGYQDANNAGNVLSYSITYVDSPATTSAITYGVEVRRGGTGTVYVNRSSQDTDDQDRARGASSITVMEIAG